MPEETVQPTTDAPIKAVLEAINSTPPEVIVAPAPTETPVEPISTAEPLDSSRLGASGEVPATQTDTFQNIPLSENIASPGSPLSENINSPAVAPPPIAEVAETAPPPVATEVVSVITETPPTIEQVTAEPVATETRGITPVPQISSLGTSEEVPLGRTAEPSATRTDTFQNIPLSENISSPVPETTEQIVSQPVPIEQTSSSIPQVVYTADPNIIKNLLNKARAKIQERKQKKLDKVMALFDTSPQIENKDVQKLLRTSSSTAVRYLDDLEKTNKVKQVGGTGKAVFYVKI